MDYYETFYYKLKKFNENSFDKNFPDGNEQGLSPNKLSKINKDVIENLARLLVKRQPATSTQGSRRG